MSMNNKSLTNSIAINGLLTALALILSFVESLIPFNFGIPGIKLGLANVVVLFMIYNMKSRDAIIVNIIRVLIAGFMFGNLNSIAFSMVGAVCSFLVMWLIHKHTQRHVIVVSIIGAIVHVLGQLLIGILWYPPRVLMYYSLFLLVAAIVTGSLLGMVTGRINHYYKAIIIRLI